MALRLSDPHFLRGDLTPHYHWPWLWLGPLLCGVNRLRGSRAEPRCLRGGLVEAQKKEAGEGPFEVRCAL